MIKAEKNSNAEIKTLPVGDYIVAPETIVERKSISDLISSVFDGSSLINAVCVNITKIQYNRRGQH